MNIKVDQKYIKIYKLFFQKLKEYGWNGNYELLSNTIKIINSDSETLESYLQKHKFMDYDLVEEMIVYLGSQLALLHQNGFGFLYFNLKNITVLDGKFFLFNSLEELCSLNKNEELICNFPIVFEKNNQDDNNNNNNYNYKYKDNNIFIAPELKNSKFLPIIANVSSSYYSFGLLCVKCLGLDIDIDMKNINLDSIYNTRIYYFLKRCLEKESNNRYFLYL